MRESDTLTLVGAYVVSCIEALRLPETTSTLALPEVTASEVLTQPTSPDACAVHEGDEIDATTAAPL